MNQTARVSDELIRAAMEYLTPQSMRKIVRSPKVEIEPVIEQIPFKGDTISFRRWGNGEIILLVHGWSANQTDMFNYVPAIVARGFCAVAMDLPSHGESSGEWAGLDRLSDGVLALGEKLGHLKGVVAHSIGGAAVSFALARGLDVERAVMLAAPKDYEANLRRFAKRKGFDEDGVVDAVRSLGVNTKIKASEFVPQITIPALLIHSTDDQVIPVETAEDLHRFWQGSQLMKVDNLQHRGVLKDAKIVEATVDYLTR